MYRQKKLYKVIAAVGLLFTGHLAVLAYNANFGQTGDEQIIASTIEEALKEQALANGSSKLKSIKADAESEAATLAVMNGIAANTPDVNSVEYYYNYIPRTESGRAQFAWERLSKSVKESYESVYAKSTTLLAANVINDRTAETDAGEAQTAEIDSATINQTNQALNTTLATAAIGNNSGFNNGETVIIAQNEPPQAQVPDSIASPFSPSNAPDSIKNAPEAKGIPSKATLTPSEVPVPAALPLMASALVAFGVGSRRTKR